MIGFSIPKRSAVWLAGLALAVVGVLGFAAPANAAGTVEGGYFYVDVAGTHIKVNSENTTLSLQPPVSAARSSISDAGQIKIENLPAGKYVVTANFELTTDDCDGLAGWALTAINPLLKVFCDTSDIGKSSWKFNKSWTVNVEDGKTVLLEGASSTAQGRYMGTAIETNADGSARVNCEGKGILMSFIICPMIENILGVMDWAIINFIQPYLAVNPLTTTDKEGNTSKLYEVWNNIRNFANIIFIATFFVIVFSQATSVGITNYGIKRLLPRLVLIAIGTNISFFVCAFLVDLFNVLGAGAASLMISSLVDGAPTVTIGADFFNRLIDFGPAGLMSSLLAQGVLSVGIIFGMFIFLIIGAAILFVAAIVILLRQIAIIFLIIISPVAFVAGLLPNTQKMFTLWFSAFARLLAMYPILILLFASGKVASSVLSEINK
ncbi:MAG TPA: hypothetical protein VFO38_01175 [Candidatus Saccharimonadales bacterium]|nr:hypothetical protein [Candidatus Saccharimonadales bacterium]